MSSPDLDEKRPLEFAEEPGKIEIDHDTGAQKVIATDGEVLTTIDPMAERALVWKLDLRVLPVLAVMYLFNSLDKSNLGNAKTAGLEKDLNLGDHGYKLASHSDCVTISLMTCPALSFPFSSSLTS
jgi:hypothetical protein